jgi:hypothetical protein
MWIFYLIEKHNLHHVAEMICLYFDIQNWSKNWCHITKIYLTRKLRIQQKVRIFLFFLDWDQSDHISFSLTEPIKSVWWSFVFWIEKVYIDGSMRRLYNFNMTNQLSCSEPIEQTWYTCEQHYKETIQKK